MRSIAIRSLRLELNPFSGGKGRFRMKKRVNMSNLSWANFGAYPFASATNDILSQLNNLMLWCDMVDLSAYEFVVLYIYLKHFAEQQNLTLLEVWFFLSFFWFVSFMSISLFMLREKKSILWKNCRSSSPSAFWVISTFHVVNIFPIFIFIFILPPGTYKFPRLHPS